MFQQKIAHFTQNHINISTFFLEMIYPFVDVEEKGNNFKMKWGSSK